MIGARLDCENIIKKQKEGKSSSGQIILDNIDSTFQIQQKYSEFIFYRICTILYNTYTLKMMSWHPS